MITGQATCDVCGTPLRAYEIRDTDTGRVVDTELDCPNAYRHTPAEAEASDYPR